MTPSQLNAWLFTNKLTDQWWVSVDGQVFPDPMTLEEVTPWAQSNKTLISHISQSDNWIKPSLKEIPQVRAAQKETKRETSSLNLAGTIFLLLGAAVTVYFFNFYDVSVETGLGRINNFGRMNDRQIGIIVGVGMAIVGGMFIVGQHLVNSKK